MKYTYEKELKMVMNDPTLVDFRQNLLAKPNGRDMFEAYVRERVQRKNQEAWFEGVSKNNPRYNDFRQMTVRRQQAEREAEEILGAPPTTLQRFVNATSVLQTDWWDKTVDVVRRVLSNPEKDNHQETSSKSSLWEVFWK